MKKLIILLFILFSFNAFGQNDYLMLTRTRPLLEVTVNGRKTAMLIDTGSSMNIICSSKLDRYGIESKDIARSISTISGVSNVKKITNVEIFAKDKIVSNFYSVDIESVCKNIESETGFEVIGILGTPAIKELKMIIDLSRGIVTINKNDVAQADN